MNFIHNIKRQERGSRVPKSAEHRTQISLHRSYDESNARPPDMKSDAYQCVNLAVDEGVDCSFRHPKICTRTQVDDTRVSIATMILSRIIKNVQISTVL